MGCNRSEVKNLHNHWVSRGTQSGSKLKLQNSISFAAKAGDRHHTPRAMKPSACTWEECPLANEVMPFLHKYWGHLIALS